LISFRGEDVIRIIQKIPITQSDDCENLQEFWSDYSWETLVANTSDDCRILWIFQSEFWCENAAVYLLIRIPARNRIRHSKLISFRGEYVTRILQRIPITQWDDCGILQEFWSECLWVTLVVSTSKYIRWRRNSLNISIRLLMWKCSCLSIDQNSSQK
jgi:hypothetical protein